MSRSTDEIIDGLLAGQSPAGFRLMFQQALRGTEPRPSQAERSEQLTLDLAKAAYPQVSAPGRLLLLDHIGSNRPRA